MSGRRLMRVVALLAPGVFVLQAAGCTFVTFNDFVQTILLGITAAGAIAILQNI